jgi:exodeoxyribonuclease V beta subunit
MSDAVFDTPLDACSLIEASAGTGKTFALAGLFVRAVIAGGLAPRQILAVTFTVAATQELRARVRLRLQQAARLLAGWQPGDPPERAGDDGETALLRRLLHAALAAGESTTALQLRLARAARDLELAQITTIDGFWQRLLSEHALEADQPLAEADIETGLAQARRQLAIALWREHAGDADGAAFLRRRFGDVDGLRAALGDLLSHEPLLPGAGDADTYATLQSAWHTLHEAFAAHGAEARAALEQATAGKVLSRARDKAPDLDALWPWLAAQDARVPLSLPAGLQRIGSDWLAGICLKGKDAQCPRSPLFDAVDALLPAFEAHDITRLHAFRVAARSRDAERKAALQLRGYDDVIAALHAAVNDDASRKALVQAVRSRFRLALIDEFQDTDARQWQVFRSLFVDAAPGDGGLVLVGDPKQAIYRFRGGDVQTYVDARADVQRDDIRLERNFRSRPWLLDATNTLFAGLPHDALGEGIAFAPVAPGGKARDDDLQLDDQPAPPLAFHVVPVREVEGKPRDWTKDDCIEMAAALCADAIRERLQLARDGRLLRRDSETGQLRAVEPRDCAVLVRTHIEAAAVRRALSRRNVPAATVDRTSLFESDEARDLLALLLALLHGGDDGRLRAALATPLFGLDAAAIDMLTDDGEALRARHRDFDDWRARWQRHGPLAMLTQVVAVQSPRLLGIDGGERRIANLLQLGELMQEAAARSLGAQGQVDWLQAAIASPDAEDEAQLPRLESDADRVQILTLHKSKGLEFPLVFLPFVGIGRDQARQAGKLKVAVHHHRGRRVRQWKTAQVPAGTPSWDEAVAAHLREERAEDMRLLYVGITRAREALWLCGGALAASRDTALHTLLGGNAPSAALRQALGDLLAVGEGLPPEMIARLAPQPPDALPPARMPTRTLRRDWWMHSFSQLHKQAPQGLHALEEEAPADDERSDLPAPAAVDPRFAGPRFGNVLHHALEHADFSAWRDRDGLPDSQRDVLLQAFAAFGYRQDEAIEGLPRLAPLLSRTLQARVPARDGVAGFRLCDLDPRDRIDEMEFHFALRGSSVQALLDVLHAHGVLRGRQGFGAWRTLSGLMTGKIDLTCRIDGRVYVLDYKTNTLPAYDDDTVAQAMADSEYDWQALLYLVALQRWLRSRLGAGYDFDTHVGGVRYLFCRGLDLDVPGQGVHALPFTRELVDAVDAVLATPLPEVAP